MSIFDIPPDALLNPPIKAGDRIQVIVRLAGGGSFLGTTQTVVSVDSSGTPYVRYRFGKVNKPIDSWVLQTKAP